MEISKKLRKINTNCKKINPEWVEWLMGWVIGWTDTKPLPHIATQKNSWDKEPDIDRIVYDYKNRAKRIKALGNGQVPACAVSAWLMLFERLTNELPPQNLNVLHLFSGAGGGIIADMMLNNNPIGAVEIDEYCRKILIMRQKDGWLPKFPIYKDVRLFDGREIQDRVDVVSGGFPCQDISCAGSGNGINGNRSSLFYELTRICRNVQPMYIFLENSPFIITRGIETVLGEISEMGYDAEWCCLGASEVGAWHRRERWWCLCKKNSIPDS